MLRTCFVLVVSMTVFISVMPIRLSKCIICSVVVDVISPMSPHSCSRNLRVSPFAIPYPRRRFCSHHCDLRSLLISSRISRGINESDISSPEICTMILVFVSEISAKWMSISIAHRSFSLYIFSIGFEGMYALNDTLLSRSFLLASWSQVYPLCQSAACVIQYVSPKSPGATADGPVGLSGTLI